MTETFHHSILKRRLTGVGITCIWAAIAIHIPIAGFFFSIFIPVTVYYYRVVLGRRFGAEIPLLSSFLAWIYIGSFNIELLLILEFLMIGFILGELSERNLSIEKTVLYSGLSAVSAGFLILMVYANLNQKSILVLAEDYIAKNLEMTVALYQNMGISQDIISVLTDSLERIKYVLTRILPALTGSFVLFVIWMTLLMARPIFSIRQVPFPDFGELNMWKAPDNLVWGVILSGGLLLVPVQSLKLIGLNGIILFMTIYFFGGIAIVSYFFEKTKFPVVIRGFLYALIAFQQIFLIVVIGLGFFDIWLNFRKVNSEK